MYKLNTDKTINVFKKNMYSAFGLDDFQPKVGKKNMKPSEEEIRNDERKKFLGIKNLKQEKEALKRLEESLRVGAFDDHVKKEYQEKIKKQKKLIKKIKSYISDLRKLYL
jgi:hypothetical protein